ncbi:MAG TPA: IPT/TIG domain-containing protein [Puia sp.]|uniref:IPT/TIG domain-containing protein n=1 Tax=Puia sp. TaxID=2045100 RepID=UPI002BC927D9|nr:IPT/TIG domain-containing protein [Puia sp.]HVU99654.1 IPT/TIG domain-containing protein [Puia sp.]
MNLTEPLLILSTLLWTFSSCKKDHAPQPDAPPGTLQIISYSPTSAAKDSVITIIGTNFSTAPGGNTVTINNLPATVLSAQSNELTVKVPPHAGIGILHVQAGGQEASASTIFQYLYTVSTLAGDGQYGFKDGAGNIAEFNAPNGVGVDGAGNVYVTTIAGDGVAGYKDGVGTNTRFNYPAGIAIDRAGNIYVADAGNYRIRKLE